jgi:hypothetical protein
MDNKAKPAYWRDTSEWLQIRTKDNVCRYAEIHCSYITDYPSYGSIRTVLKIKNGLLNEKQAVFYVECL